MFAKPGVWDLLLFGSRSMTLSFLRPVDLGTIVRLHSRAVSVGKNMIYLEARMESLDGKKLYATCQHHMVGFPVTGKAAEEYGRRLKRSKEVAEQQMGEKARI